MKIPTISLKRALEVTMNDAVKRINELDGLANCWSKRTSNAGAATFSNYLNSFTGGSLINNR